MWRLATMLAALMLCLVPATGAAESGTGCAAIPVIGVEGDASFANLQTRMPVPLKSGERTTRYEIGATLDAGAHTLRGNQRMHWRNRSSVTVCALYLHQDLNAFEGHGTRYMARQRTHGVEPQVPRGEWGYSQITLLRQDGMDATWTYAKAGDMPSTDRSVVRVALPQPVPPDATTTLELGFIARLPGAWAASGRVGDFHFASAWFPQVAALQLPGERGAPALRWNAPAFAGGMADRERADFDVHMEVPHDYVAVSSGHTLDVTRSRNGRRDYHFVQYGAATLAWAADPRFAAQPLEYPYVSGNGTPVTLRVFYRPGQAATAAGVLATMADALSRYTAALGTYPASTWNAVIAPRNADALAAQTVPGLFAALAAPTTDASAAIARERHVLAALGSAYLPEGTDERFRSGVQRYWVERFLQAKGDARDTQGEGWLHALVAPWQAAFLAQRARARERSDDDGAYARHVARVLQDLEPRIGTAAMDRAFRAWRHSARAGYPDTGQVRWLMADGSGRPGAFLQAFALMDAGRPVDDRIVSFGSQELLPAPGYVLRGGTRIEASAADVRRAIDDRRRRWKQAPQGAGPFAYRTEVVVQRDGAIVPRVLTVTFADGSTRSIEWRDGRNPARFHWTTPTPAVSALLDPQQPRRLDRNRFDDGRTLQVQEGPVRRWSQALADLALFAASWVAQL
jgi:hypothetical protein